MKKFVRMLLFLALMMLKVSAATVYFHDCEDDEPADECALCDQAINNQNTEFSTPLEFQSFEIDTELFLYEPKIHFEKAYRNMPCVNRYFGRPPPSF